VKVRFSPLVSEASGKAGPIVASRWKGINYFRELVTPANPNSLGTRGQAEHRARMTKLVHWWQSFETQLKDYIKLMAQGLPMSGFNLYMNRNLYLVSLGTTLVPKSAENPTIVTPGSDVEPIGTFVAATGAAGKHINLTWTQELAAAADKLYIFRGLTSGDGVIAPTLNLQEKETTAANALSLTLTVPGASSWYIIIALIEHTADSSFSLGVCDYAQSSAA